ncbi:MAG: bifunctional phosphoglucose/phosphomannose isomerase [Chloroflexi bacterium]|nr:bifunctional phosphoglucose/phosphomannose isomerase [Chloroflexota bacterium]
MDLDDFLRFASIDPEDMIGHIVNLPDQFQSAWKLGLESPLPEVRSFNRVVISGMGGSAIGADLLASYLADRVTLPILIHRDYGLPAYASGSETLVVVSSHSGNTEESLSAFDEALRNQCQVVVISTGGKLSSRAKTSGIPVWTFVHQGQPRAAVGFSFGLLLALFVRLGLLSDPSIEVEKTIELMREVSRPLQIDVPVKNNPAKRMAGQMVGRHITVFGSGFMSPVARRWKCQFNEVANAIASFEALPEADHNTLAGVCNPSDLLQKEISIFLQASTDLSRNQKRVDETRKIMMQEGFNTDLIEAKGETRLMQMWSTLLLGDYISYYLAIAYDSDPTAIAPIMALKEAMSK